jgi:hypothetical protein
MTIFRASFPSKIFSKDLRAATTVFAAFIVIGTFFITSPGEAIIPKDLTLKLFVTCFFDINQL